MAKASKCPYCNSTDIKRTSIGYIEEGIGMTLGCGISLLAGSIGLSHVRSQGIREFIPTNYKCNRCHKTFDVISIGGIEECCNEDVPDNIKKLPPAKIYSCLVTKVDMSSLWYRFNTKRVISSYGDLSSEQFEYFIAHLPQKLSFESMERLNEFKESLANYNGRCEII